MIKKTAKQIAKTIAQEPIEILKTAGRQVAGVEIQEKPKEEPQHKPIDQQKLKAQSTRQLQALNTEIRDIQVQKQREEMQQKQQEIVVPPPVAEAPPKISSKPTKGKMFGIFQKKKHIETRQQGSN